jgi:predicted membrane-bound spermidine synthase
VAVHREPRRIVLIAYLLVLAFCAGFTMMLVEITAARLLAPYFGSSNYIWTNVIGAILAALTGGYYVGGKIADRWPRLGTALLLGCVAGAITLVVPFLCRTLSVWVIPEATDVVTAVPVYVRASLLVTLLVFAPPLFLIGTISPLVVRLLSESGGVGWASGANSAAMTAGAILGTFAPTLWLVPWLGSRQTILAGGAVLLLAVAAGLLVRGRVAIGAAAVAAVLLVPFGLEAALPPILVEQGLVEARETSYQYARVIREDGELTLRCGIRGGGKQSIFREDSHLTGGTVFDHFLGLPFLTDKRPGEPLRVLVVGLGAGTVSRQYYHFFGDVFDLSLDGVEIDPELVELGRRHFELGGPEQYDLGVYVADGRRFVATTEKLYDVVIIDVFSRQASIPFHLATHEFFEQIEQRLAPGGVMAMNVLISHLPSRVFEATRESVARAFGQAWYYRIPDSFNVLLLSRDGRPIDGIAAMSKLRRLPEGWVSVSELGTLRSELWDGFSELVRRAPEPGQPFFTDDWVPAEHLTVEDQRASWEGS